ncbi:MAG: hypothetical protein M3Y87_21060, partial [Myxococcota bacterium]|nr:hypothetical protein [Myxococcota bacterium]
MSASAMLLLVAAASLHATWNALTKRARDPFAFLWLSMSVAVLTLAPVAIVIAVGEEAFDPGAALGPILGSGAVHAMYFVALAGAYRHGDLSIVYPIARGLGVGLVPLLAAVFLAERIADTGALGIAIVVVGIAVTGFGARTKTVPPTAARAPRRGVLLAILTGVLIATYSLLDRTGARAMHPIPFLVLTTALALAGSAPLALARRAALRA